jgi:hypothetical protein
VTVIETGHAYRTVNGSVSNHFSGRAADIGAVGGMPVAAGNAAARELALALGALPADLRPTEIGSPWAIDGPAYFTDADHRDHLHVAFDDPLGVSAVADTPATASEPSPVPVVVPAATRALPAPSEPQFAPATATARSRAAGDEPRFEVRR